MGRLIDQLLDVSRLTRGMIHLDRARLDLSELVRHALKLHAPAAEARGITLSGCAEVPVWVEGDETRLAQVLDNLLNNALKFSHKGGRIAIEAVAEDGAALLRVSDNGEGIAADVLPTLFEPFAQADHSLDRTGGGLGLGLSMVKGLVELHGGSVAARSAGPGQGSTFSVRLPLAPAAQPPGRTLQCQVGGDSGRQRVLVAEDNVDAAETLRLILELSGYEVQVVHNGRDAVQAALAWAPDAVVCDIGLPEMSGYDVARALRAEARTQQALLVAVTGYGTSGDKAAAREAGFDAHFAKPVAVEELLAQLQEHATAR